MTDLAKMTDDELAALQVSIQDEMKARTRLQEVAARVVAAVQEYANVAAIDLVDAWRAVIPRDLLPATPVVPTAPNWKQPQAGSEYKKGDRVTYKGAVYESLINKNGWSPDAYPAGWKKLA